jgi:hypothetical protein
LHSARHACGCAGHDRDVTAFGQIGLFTTALELAATSIGAGIVVGGFIVASIATLTGRSQRGGESKFTARCLCRWKLRNVLSAYGPDFEIR